MSAEQPHSIIDILKMHAHLNGPVDHRQHGGWSQRLGSSNLAACCLVAFQVQRMGRLKDHQPATSLKEGGGQTDCSAKAVRRPVLMLSLANTAGHARPSLPTCKHIALRGACMAHPAGPSCCNCT